MNPVGIFVGGALFIAVGAGVYILSSSIAPTDPGGVTQSQMPDRANVPPNEQMKPVTTEEANRRATVNQQDAEKAVREGRTYQAPTVISGVGPADKGEVPDVDTSPPKPPTERVVKETVERTEYVYRVPVQQPVDDQLARQRVQAQLDSLVQGTSGSNGASNFMVTRVYSPVNPRKEEADRNRGGRGDGGSGQGGGSDNGGGNGNGNGPSQSAAPKPSGPAPRMVARAGDVIYGRIDRAFNSDDPGAPIVMTLDDVIADPQRGTRAGPLTGTRLIGEINYSRDQASIVFARLVTVNGQQIPISGIAISEKEARTGVAAKVDYHTLQRYSGLVLAGMIQGAGQVGTQLLAQNQNYTITPAGQVYGGGGSVSYGQAAAAALQPVGSALSSAAAANFSRPPTFSAPAGMGLAVVFLQPVVLPPAAR